MIVIRIPTILPALALSFVLLGRTSAFVIHSCQRCPAVAFGTQQLFSASGDEDTPGDSEGADLAAEFYQMAQLKGVSIDESDLLDEDDEEEEEEDEEDDEEEPNIPQGAIDAFVGYDPNANEQMYSEVKDRVLDTAGGFVDMISGPDEDDDEDNDSPKKNEPAAYVPPTTVPDPELTAGEVVLLVLSALKNNDNPTTNKGVEILFGYSSPGSQIKQEEGLTPTEYGEFLKETEYKVLFEHMDATIDKGEYSFEGKKGFFTARLRTGQAAGDSISVNFILSGSGPNDDDAAWLIDSILIRPQSIRRRRRK